MPDRLGWMPPAAGSKHFWTDWTDYPTVSGMKPLQLQEAKQQFSAVAEKAARGQPQIVTKHGKPFVVIVNVADWEKAQPRKKSLLEVLRSCPVDLTELDLTRSKELPREIEW